MSIYIYIQHIYIYTYIYMITVFIVLGIPWNSHNNGIYIDVRLQTCCTHHATSVLMNHHYSYGNTMKRYVRTHVQHMIIMTHSSWAYLRYLWYRLDNMYIYNIHHQRLYHIITMNDLSVASCTYAFDIWPIFLVYLIYLSYWYIIHMWYGTVIRANKIPSGTFTVFYWKWPSRSRGVLNHSYAKVCQMVLIQSEF